MFHFDGIHWYFFFFFETDVFIDMIEKRKKKINYCPEPLQFWITDHGFLVIFLYILYILVFA